MIIDANFPGGTVTLRERLENVVPDTKKIILIPKFDSENIRTIVCCVCLQSISENETMPSTFRSFPNWHDAHNVAFWLLELVFTDNIIGGVIGSFFSAGYEPTAAALTFCLYELARNPQVQAKLHEEILAVKEKLGDDIEYETLKEFKYANQVIDGELNHPYSHDTIF